MPVAFPAALARKLVFCLLNESVEEETPCQQNGVSTDNIVNFSAAKIVEIAGEEPSFTFSSVLFYTCIRQLLLL